jgi:Ankyrin repeat
VRLLIASGADLHQTDGKLFTALHWSALRGFPVVAEALLVAGARTDVKDHKDRTPLQVWFWVRHADALNVCLYIYIYIYVCVYVCMCVCVLHLYLCASVFQCVHTIVHTLRMLCARAVLAVRLGSR